MTAEADALARICAAACPPQGRAVTPEDRALIDASRLLGHDRPRARTPTSELVIEGEYALRRLAELAGEPDGEQRRSFYYGMLDGIQEEAERRLRHPQPFHSPSRIAPEMLDRIREAVPCQEFIQWGGSDLKPAGPGRWVRRCPLLTHRDSTPSFTVWADGWHCFGCGQGGDVFEWARLRAGLAPGQFAEAVRIVAAYAGIDPGPGGDRPKLSLPRNA